MESVDALRCKVCQAGFNVRLVRLSLNWLNEFPPVQDPDLSGQSATLSGRLAFEHVLQQKRKRTVIMCNEDSEILVDILRVEASKSDPPSVDVLSSR